jgi:hypothetical protein
VNKVIIAIICLLALTACETATQPEQNTDNIETEVSQIESAESTTVEADETTTSAPEKEPEKKIMEEKTLSGQQTTTWKTDEAKYEIKTQVKAPIMEDDKKVGEVVETEAHTQATGIDMTIKATVEIITECGGQECFEQQFANCEPATATYKMPNSFTGIAAETVYTIHGPKDDGCEMTIDSITGLFPEMNGLSMTCVFDNTQPLTTATNNIIMSLDKCEGSMADFYASFGQ